MNNKAIFLDRDGVINIPIVNNNEKIIKILEEFLKFNKRILLI